MGFLAGNNSVDGFAVRFTGASARKDLFKLAHFLGEFLFFQRTESRSNHFGAVVVTA